MTHNAPKRALGSPARELSDIALQFLSTASNESLCGCLLGLGIFTYVVLGRIGLLLIGIFCGIVAHATWENSPSNDGNTISRALEVRRKREAGLEVVKRALDWRESKTEDTEDRTAATVASSTTIHKELDFADFKPATGAALTGLVDAVIRDYVKWWYDPMLWFPDNSFPLACRQTLTSFLSSISSHLSRKRPADTFIDFLTNTTSIVIVFLSELSGALMVPSAVDLEPAEVIRLYLEEKPGSNLAIVLDVKQQQKKFKEVAEDILQKFLDTKAFQCEPARVFLRQVLAGIVLESALNSCSKPEWINAWIVSLLEGGEPELMNAIDAGVGGVSVKRKDVIGETVSTTTYMVPESLFPESSSDTANRSSSHQRTISKAEDAMENALLEARRLTELIASEDAIKGRVSDEATSSGNTTEANATPTSSQSDLHASGNRLDILLEEGAERLAGPPSDTIPEDPKAFTSFDQILPLSHPAALRSSTDSLVPSAPPPLTLHNAKISIFDDSQPGERSNIRSKPVIEYLLQIEPASSAYPGWMIARKYNDFETLHEVLRRISVISGVSGFTLKYSTIPTWKNQTKDSFRDALERYLHEALSHGRLAESEGMKRFLEKDQALSRSPAGKGLLGFPSPETFQNMGKGMLDVLASAPKGAAKGAAGGGKALFEGVSGVFGQKKGTSSSKMSRSSRSVSLNSTSRASEDHGPAASAILSDRRQSQDIFRDSTFVPGGSLELPPLPQRPSSIDQEARDETASEPKEGPNLTTSKRLSPGGALEQADAQATSNIDNNGEPKIHLPPLPSEISDDYNSTTGSPHASTSVNDASTYPSSISSRPASILSPSRNEVSLSLEHVNNTSPSSPIKPKREAFAPVSEQETQVAVELFFATINELYTLSSAWNIRRTLLNAAKAFLLRPGNPNLEAIRVLLQDTVIEANTSDAGIAAHLLKLRENTLPTEIELATWPPPLTDDEKARLRVKARKLLVEKGMPQALTSVMGGAASGEALGRVFDSLQVEEVTRGFIFALLLQGVRAMTH